MMNVAELKEAGYEWIMHEMLRKDKEIERLKEVQQIDPHVKKAKDILKEAKVYMASVGGQCYDDYRSVSAALKELEAIE